VLNQSAQNGTVILPRPEGFEWIEAYLQWQGRVEEEFDEDEDDWQQ
jgi:hypothetical protein